MIVLFNPRSTTPGKQPLPLSVMSLAAVLDGRESWSLVDGNLTQDAAAAIVERLSRVRASEMALLGVTVMPGPQLAHAIDVCRAVRAARPHVPIVWGGYFPTQHTATVLESSYVDFVIRSQGEQPLLKLVDVLRNGGGFESVPSLSWKRRGEIVNNPIGTPTPLDDLPDLPYARVDMGRYIQPNYLGRRTIAHNSSFGCPFACAFCAVVAMSNRRWLAQSPARMERVLRHLVSTYGIDAVQMNDMDFFISEERVADFAERIAPLDLAWWALGRIDRLAEYSNRTWTAMARSGLKMVFSGAESGSAETLKAMNKGGRSAPELAVDVAARMRRYGIVPEFSFVLGAPPDPEGDIAHTFEFIRRIKRVNPATEVILYTYTPVPSEQAMFGQATRQGFAFPRTLDEWASDEWKTHALRRGAGLPWISRPIRQRVRNFERVLNAYYPTVTDPKLTRTRRALLRTASAWRYWTRLYAAPYELRALQKLFAYQRPETTGF